MWNCLIHYAPHPAGPCPALSADPGPLRRRLIRSYSAGPGPPAKLTLVLIRQFAGPNLPNYHCLFLSARLPFPKIVQKTSSKHRLPPKTALSAGLFLQNKIRSCYFPPCRVLILEPFVSFRVGSCLKISRTLTAIAAPAIPASVLPSYRQLQIFPLFINRISLRYLRLSDRYAGIKAPSLSASPH